MQFPEHLKWDNSIQEKMWISFVEVNLRINSSKKVGTWFWCGFEGGNGNWEQSRGHWYFGSAKSWLDGGALQSENFSYLFGGHSAQCRPMSWRWGPWPLLEMGKVLRCPHNVRKRKAAQAQRRSNCGIKSNHYITNKLYIYFFSIF